MIKLIASDLDGTLIGHDFRFRPRTLRALEAARTAGIDIVFVTGRPSRWLTPPARADRLRLLRHLLQRCRGVPPERERGGRSQRC